jgi:hypothetical protein
MPLRRFLSSNFPPLLCSELELRGWRQLLLLDRELPETGEAIMADATIRASLLRRSAWDDQAVSVVNALCPHWPPLCTRTSLERRASQDIDVDPTDALRLALGLDPSLPWDLFMAAPSSVPSDLRV